MESATRWNRNATRVRRIMKSEDKREVNPAEQHPQERLEDVSAKQLERTFRSNVFAMFHLAKAALPYLGKGSRIINTTSVTAYRGSPHLVDYAATKGAIVGFTRSLALQLAERGILVNAVA